MPVHICYGYLNTNNSYGYERSYLIIATYIQLNTAVFILFLKNYLILCGH